MTRREVLDGNSAYKQFVGAGGGEGLLFVIAASIATFGGQKRSAMFDRFAAMDDGQPRNAGAVSHIPTVTISPAKSQASGSVSVEVAAPAASASSVDFMWIKDADTGVSTGAAPNRPCRSPRFPSSSPHHPTLCRLSRLSLLSLSLSLSRSRLLYGHPGGDRRSQLP